MFVITVDQQGSRHAEDHVPELLAGLPPIAGLVRAPERTVGDEVQAVLDDAGGVVDLVLHLLRRGGWSVGVGAGPVEEPLPASSREARGEAFVLARAAVEAAKSRNRPVPLAVRGADPTAAGDAEAVLTLIGSLAARRSTAGWAAIDQARALGTERQDAIAERLGVSQQAVSQRLRAAHWVEESAARPAAARLLTAAAG